MSKIYLFISLKKSIICYYCNIGAWNNGGSNVSYAIVPDRDASTFDTERDSAERSRIIIASRSRADISSQIQTKRLLPVSSRAALPSRPSGIVRRLLIIRDILCVRFQWSASPPTASRLINYPGEYSRHGWLEEETGAKLATSDLDYLSPFGIWRLDKYNFDVYSIYSKFIQVC